MYKLVLEFGTRLLEPEMKVGGGLAVLILLLVVLGVGVEAERRLSHPALTGSATLTLKVLYW